MYQLTVLFHAEIRFSTFLNHLLHKLFKYLALIDINKGWNKLHLVLKLFSCVSIKSTVVASAFNRLHVIHTSDSFVDGRTYYYNTVT